MAKVRKLKKARAINCTCSYSEKGLGTHVGRDCVCRVISGKFGRPTARDIPTKIVAIIPKK